MKRIEPPTLSFLSLQFRQPYLDLRIVLRSRAPLGQVDVILNSRSDAMYHSAGRAFRSTRDPDVEKFQREVVPLKLVIWHHYRVYCANPVSDMKPHTSYYSAADGSDWLMVLTCS
jgi:hypothetical protein